MTRNTRLTLITLASVGVMLAISVGYVWFARNYEKVEKTYYLPPRGEAGYNPLYALKRTLQADGIKINARQRLGLAHHVLQPGDTLLFYSDPAAVLPSETERLLAWVESGGHLLLRTPRPSHSEDGSGIALLQRIGIQPLPTDTYPTDCVPFKVEGDDEHVEFCNGRRFHLMDQEPLLSWGDLEAGYVYARMRHGRGQVDVLADFDFLDNGGSDRGMVEFETSSPPQGGLRDGPHRALTRNLLAPNYGKGTVHLVYAAQIPSLFRTLLTRGWMVWLPLALALAAWLWMRMQRFGPRLPAPASARRSLLEHVRASGEHLFRYGRGVLLYGAVRRAFLARLRRRDPVAAALTGEAQVAAIAQRMKLPVDSVRRAMQAPASHEKVHFRERISNLVQMRNQL